MIDILKKTLTLAAICGFAVLIILGCFYACQQAMARGEQQRQQQLLVEMFGLASLCIQQNDSLSYPGTSWKIGRPGSSEIQYAFAIESAPDAALPGGIVAVNAAGTITDVRLSASLEEALSLKVLLYTLLTRRRYMRDAASQSTPGASFNFGRKCIGMSLVKPLEIIVRANQDAPGRVLPLRTRQENTIVATPFEAPLYRMLWNTLPPAAHAFLNRTYGSVIP